MGGAGIQNEDKMSLGKKELSFPEKESHQKKKKERRKTGKYLNWKGISGYRDVQQEDRRRSMVTFP